MNWINHIFRPFVIYLPLLAEITFIPWRFIKNVLAADSEYEEKLRRCSFFLISLYLIIQPYVLQGKSSRLTSSEGGGLVKTFMKEIILLSLIVPLSLLFMLIERKNKHIKLDTFLNLLIPVLSTAIFLNTMVDILALVYLGKIGLSHEAIYNQCKGLYDYRCLGELLHGQSGAPYAFSLTNSLIEGHFMALLFLLYIFGLDPLRNNMNFPVKSRAVKVGTIILFYLFVHLLGLHFNDIL